MGTVGQTAGTATRGLADTVHGTTGQNVGKPLADVGDGVEGGTDRVSKTTKDAGQWKT